MKEGLERHGIRQIGSEDSEQKQQEGGVEDSRLQGVSGNAGEKSFQDNKIVEADEDSQKEKCGAAAGPASDDRQVGSEPVGPADEHQGIDRDDGIGDK